MIVPISSSLGKIGTLFYSPFMTSGRKRVNDNGEAHGANMKIDMWFVIARVPR